MSLNIQSNENKKNVQNFRVCMNIPQTTKQIQVNIERLPMIMSQVLSFATLMQDKRPVILGNLEFGEQGKSKKCFKLFSFSGCQNSEARNYINDIRHKCL